jgi:hypothetical protein
VTTSATVDRSVSPGLIQLEWFRRGRYFGINVGLPDTDRIMTTRVSLARILQLGHITRAEANAALDEIEAPPIISHQDIERHPEHVEMRINVLPDDCTGKSVLDIGGYDGEIAAECLKRGATSAIVYDNGEWTDYSWSKPIVKEGCTYQRGDLMYFGAEAPKPADIVLLYNVIYHLRDPWTALERCRLLTKETFVLCTSFMEGDDPVWHLQGRNDDDVKINETHTIFWRPTIAGMRRMLELTGFTIDKQEGPVGDHICFRCH